MATEVAFPPEHSCSFSPERVGEVPSLRWGQAELTVEHPQRKQDWLRMTSAVRSAR